MIKRINLIEKTPLSFTYQKLMKICLIVFLINVALVGFQFFMLKWTEPNLAEEKSRLKRFNAERETLMATPVKRKVSNKEYQELFDELDSVPLWSKFLQEIIWNLPNSVWLTNVKTLSFQSEDVAKKGKKADKQRPEDTKDKMATDSRFKGFEFSGICVDVRAVAEFLTKLEKTTIFTNLTLKNSQKENFGYQFTVQGDVVLEYAR